MGNLTGGEGAVVDTQVVDRADERFPEAADFLSQNKGGPGRLGRDGACIALNPIHVNA